MDVPILGKPKPGENVQNIHIRLLVCADCKSMDEIPDFEGHPDDDVLLKIACESHVWPTGTEHKGNIFRIPLKFYGNPKVRESMIKQIQAGVSGGLDDVEKGWYDAKSQFAADAMSCFEKHLKPAGRCPDWMNDSKKLVPKTAAERKDAGMNAPGQNGAPSTYLCSFCPASIFMTQKRRELAGMYD